MTHKLNSPAARAKLKAYIEADKPKKARMPKPLKYEIKTKADFAGWAAQYPGPKRVLLWIVRRWSASSAVAPGSKGKWAAYTHEEWTAYLGGSIATLKRHLDKIEEAGLIERALHRHGGTAPKSFIRPTALALVVAMNAKEADWKRLGYDEPPSASVDHGDLAAFFREAYTHATGKTAPKLTMTQRKHLNEFGKHCPTELDPRHVMAYAISCWDDFAKMAGNAAGIYTLPKLPRPEFLRTHMHIAIDLYMANQKAPKTGSG